MISAWARMCKIIGPGFVQYLPVVMGPLLQAASIKPEIVILDCECCANVAAHPCEIFERGRGVKPMCFVR